MWLKIISFLSAKQWTMVVLVIKLSLWGKAANKNRSSGSWRKTVSGLKKNPAATKRVISHQRLLEILYNNKNILFWRKQAYKRYVLYLMPQNICFTAIFIRGNSIVFRNKGPSLMEQNSMSMFYLQIISVVSNYCPAGGHFFSLLPFSNSLNSVKKIMDSKHSPVRDGRIAVSVRYQGVRAGRPLLPCRVFWFMTNYIIKFLWLVNPIATQIKLVVSGRFVSLWVFIIRCNSSVYQMSVNRKCLKKHSI